ncbi:hypothetical protein AUC68_09905 [Methyloceanibacter methanicus]|uniref:Uncharacterized protein n=1 Tax=Methyloceanibacter methanicus TaxID=1774968 RepID=A0A1E3VZK3_9HYPH|nr:tetratricopeptide repeat protein [Methyloceanibacter methanicus]ODR98691.1 hypothetical protein AUC68_09905 [Methyloceanibacter methanicus]
MTLSIAKAMAVLAAMTIAPSAALGEDAPSPVAGGAQLPEALALCTDTSRPSYTASPEVQKEQADARKKACVAVLDFPGASEDDKYAAHIGLGQLRVEYLRIGGFADFHSAMEIKPGAAEPRFLGGRDLMHSSGTLEQSLEYLDAALERDPNMAEAQFARAEALYRLKRYNQAKAAYEAAIKIDPDAKAAPFARGGAAFVLKRYDEAIAAFDAALARDPRNALARLLRGYAHLNARQYDEAIADFGKAPDGIQGHGPRVGLYLWDRWCHSVRTCATWGANKAKQQITLTRLAREEKAKREKKQAAQREKEQAALKEPAGPWPQAKIDKALDEAVGALEAKKFDVAVSVLTPLVEDNPDYALGRSLRARAYVSTGELAKAEEDLTEILQIAPADAKQRLLRASLYLKRNNYQGAVDDLSKIIDAGSDDWTVWFRRGLAYKELNQPGDAIGDFHEAFNVLKASKLDGARARDAEFNVRYERAIAYSKLGKYDQAVEDFDAVITMKPDAAQLYFLRGSALAYAGRMDEAMKDANEALELEPDHELAQRLRAGIESAQKKSN